MCYKYSNYNMDHIKAMIFMKDLLKIAFNMTFNMTSQYI